MFCPSYGAARSGGLPEPPSHYSRSPVSYSEKRIFHFQTCTFSNKARLSKHQDKAIDPFTSFPNTSHPLYSSSGKNPGRLRANSSTLGKSPKSRTIRSRTSAGFCEWRPAGAITTCPTFRCKRFSGFPRVNSKTYSALALV
jgi:hypothetical protein